MDKLANKVQAAYFPMGDTDANVWGVTRVEKLSFEDRNVYAKSVKNCRFYYRHESLAFSVVTKMVDLAINDLVITPEGRASKTEEQIYDALREDLIKFLRKCALEYLITGLVVPEITLTRLAKNALRDKGIQRIDSLLYPTDTWVRDAKDIEIKSPMLSSGESYYLIIPEETIDFIINKGQYDDGEKDIELYNEIIKKYPEFVEKIRRGATKILLDNPLIIKATELADSQYPIPYLYPALESFKHKRNLKRMDYSIASRVISAILHVTAGSDDFPLTEDQEGFLDDLESKFKWREGAGYEEFERVFTLFTNHTVNINWVFPDIDVLLDEAKYATINRDIVVSLGFPNILITGETERSFTSDPEIATLSPLNTLRVMRNTLLPIIKKVFTEMRNTNRLMTVVPKVKFKPINLIGLQTFYEGLDSLYMSGNLSRYSYTEAYGYDLTTELEHRAAEKEAIDELGLEEFAPVPHSNEPKTGGTTAPKSKK